MSTSSSYASWNWLRSAVASASGKQNSTADAPQRPCVPRLQPKQHLTHPQPHESLCARYRRIYEGPSGAPTGAQRSGSGGERRNSGRSEFSPVWAKTRDLELVTTTSRIKARSQICLLCQSQLPAVRAVDGDFRDIKGDVCFSNKNGLWRLCPSTPLFPKNCAASEAHISSISEVL